MDSINPPTAAALQTTDVELLRQAMLLANTYVVTSVESAAPRVHLPEPGRWFDTRPMLDDREHAPQAIDLSRQVLDYGLLSGVVHRHSQQPYLVRLIPDKG